MGQNCQGGGDSSLRDGHKAQHPAAMLSIWSGGRVTTRRVMHQDGHVRDNKWPQVQAWGGRRSEVTSGVTGMSEHQPPPFQLPRAPSSASCWHQPILTSLSPGRLSPPFLPNTPTYNRRLSPLCWCHGDAPGALWVGVTHTQASVSLSAPGRIPASASASTRRGGWKSSAQRTHVTHAAALLLGMGHAAAHTSCLGTLRSERQPQPLS